MVNDEGLPMAIYVRLITSVNRGALVAMAAALLVTAVMPTTTVAAPAETGTKVTAAHVGDATDFSAARRHRRTYVRRGNAAGMAFMGAVLGTMGAIIAEQQRREYYERYDAPYPYGGPYYGRPYPYYGPRYYPY
jgi:hypothetical protein